MGSEESEYNYQGKQNGKLDLFIASSLLRKTLTKRLRFCANGNVINGRLFDSWCVIARKTGEQESY